MKRIDTLEEIVAGCCGNVPAPAGDGTAAVEIPPELLERLTALDTDPAQFPESFKRRGEAFFLSFLKEYIKRKEEQISLFQEWSPKLREFAVNCRSRNRCPNIEALDIRDRAKLQIYEDKISKAERLPSRRHSVTICNIPLIGIPVVERLWPGENDDTIILTPEEQSQWARTYKHPEDAHWWWIGYWWHIEDPPDRHSIRNRDRDLSLPEAGSPWLVESRLIWGPLAGGSTTELWSWDGTQAKFVRQVGLAQF